MTHHDPRGITLVALTRNEEPTVGKILERAAPLVEAILVMDGHSKDGTREEARRLGAQVVLDQGRGKGHAMRQAMGLVQTPIMVFIDTDGSHSPEDIPALVAPLQAGQADLVIGSRTRGGSDELHGDLPKFIRMIGSDIITLTINYRWNIRLSDSQNGFKAMLTDVARQLHLVEDIFTIEQEIIMQCLRHKFRVAEVPTHEYARAHGESNINLLRVSPRYVWCLLREVISPVRYES